MKYTHTHTICMHFVFHHHQRGTHHRYVRLKMVFYILPAIILQLLTYRQLKMKMIQHKTTSKSFKHPISKYHLYFIELDLFVVVVVVVIEHRILFLLLLFLLLNCIDLNRLYAMLIGHRQNGLSQ